MKQLYRCLVVVHHPTVSPVADRLRWLRNGHELTMRVTDAASLDIGGEEFYAEVGTERRFRVVHLVPDQAKVHLVDSEGELNSPPESPWVGLPRILNSTKSAVIGRYPALRGHLQQWVVTSLGATLDDDEARAIELLADQRIALSVGGLITVSTTAINVAMGDEEAIVAMADVAHSLVASSVGDLLEGQEHRTWRAGVASVTYRPDIAFESVATLLSGPLAEITAPLRVSSTARSSGRNAAERIGLAVHHRSDDALDAVLTASADSGSVYGIVAERIREIESRLIASDPGMWSGLLGYELDRLTMLSGESQMAISPLGQALSLLARNEADYKSEITKQVRSEAASQWALTPTCADLDDWCDGFESRLIDERDRLQLVVSEVEAHQRSLAEHAHRLARTAQWLPQGNSLLVRGLLAVVLLAVASYSFAVLPQIIAFILGVPLPPFSDSPEVNNQYWARITAAAGGLALGLWWVYRWRKAIRWRRHYLRTAEDLVRSRIAEEARLARLRILDTVQAILGTASDAGSLRHWVELLRTTAYGLVDRLGSDPQHDVVVPTSRFSMIVPSPEDVDRFRLSVDDSTTQSIRANLTEAVCQSLVSDSSVDTALSVDSLARALARPPIRLQDYLERADVRRQEVTGLLQSRMSPTTHLDRSPTISEQRFVVADDDVWSHLSQASWDDLPAPTHVDCEDDLFAATVWLKSFSVSRAEQQVSTGDES